MKKKLSNKKYSFLALMALFSGCAVFVGNQLDEKWGSPEPQSRIVEKVPSHSTIVDYHEEIQPIFNGRCVVCHACYDAPCQLNLSSFDGVDRGSNVDLVYNGTRFLADEPTRLGVDAKTTSEWRDKGFYPVLNERQQTPEANLSGSKLFKMLQLKNKHPLPAGDLLPSSIPVGLARSQQCSPVEGFDGYASANPLWGMPYGLPGISEEDQLKIEQWLREGALVIQKKDVPKSLLNHVRVWEEFLNKEDKRSRLVSRYIYEHLFLANLYFDSNIEGQFFKMVRSTSAPGNPVQEIASRRPFDDPGVSKFFYRLKPVNEAIVDKTHMPYRLDKQRMQRWTELFFDIDYDVASLPSYRPETSSNPFLTFNQIPAKSRYQFMLDEAQFTIMAYIKGPVCRGQVALNVIEDQFWVFFLDPDVEQMLYQSDLERDSLENYQLPASDQSNALPTEMWTKYARLKKRQHEEGLKYMQENFPEGTELSLDAIWDGNGENKNAALTIFRHYDSATVVKGLKGPKPETAWVVSYGLLERIHYLLVAGFDVYGNLGHQLNTRLYMDFLRMEGETVFLLFMPEKDAEKELYSWYRDAEGEVIAYVDVFRKSNFKRDQINYQSKDTKSELFDKLISHLGPEISGYDITPSELKPLVELQGESLSWMPENTVMKIIDSDASAEIYTLLINRAHSNVSSFLMENSRYIPSEQTVSLLPGVVGSYPNSFLVLHKDKIPTLANKISLLKSESDYRILKDEFGLRRTAANFWAFSDWLHDFHLSSKPISAGILDYNRLENR